LLEQENIDVFAKNESGSTPLHYFTRNFDATHYNEEQEGLVAALIKKGADVNAKNSNGETPLHNACWSKNLSIIKVLLANRGNINLQTELGETCLIWAIRAGDPSIVNFLLQKGVDINLKGKNGSALDVLTVIGGNSDIERLLKERLAAKSKSAEPLPSSKLRSSNNSSPPQSPVSPRTAYAPIPSVDSPPELPEDSSDEEELPPKPNSPGPKRPIAESGTLAIDPNSYESLMTNLSQFQMEDEEKLFANRGNYALDDDEDEDEELPGIPSEPVFSDDEPSIEVPVPQFD